MSKLNFDKIYIISLDHSQGTYDKIAKKLNDLGLSRSVPYEIVRAHDGNTDKLPENYHVYDKWLLPESNNKWWSQAVTASEIGCTISHINCWQKIIKDNVKSALILEEDFLPQRSISDLNQPGLIYDLAYLGKWLLPEREDTKIPNETQWFYSGASYNTHAYVITNSCALKFLDYNLHKNIIPVDEFIMATYSDHARKDVRELYANKNVVSITPNEDYIEQETNTMKNTTYFEILDDSDWEEWKSKYVNHTLAKGEYDLMLDDLGNNVYEFQLFTEKFCREAVALAEAKDNWTIDRHEFYPTNDVLLQDIDLQKIYHRVLKEVVYPLCIHVWTLEGAGWKDMFSENFMARYTTDRQSHLSLHHDFSHVTMVVKLNDEFEGGGTWFPKYNLLSNPKKIGTATLHPGMVTHLHGARPIDSGKRYIVVSFMRKEK